MDSANLLAEILKGITPLLPITIWLLARRAIQSRPSSPSPAQGRMTNTQEIATSVSGWSTTAAERRGGSPPPTPSPHSNPMWDRELDG
jgi:hypothetical protein